MSTVAPSHGHTPRLLYHGTRRCVRFRILQIGIHVTCSNHILACDDSAVPEPSTHTEVGVAVVGSKVSYLISKQATRGHVIEIEHVSFKGTTAREVAQRVDHLVEHPVFVCL